MYEKMQTLYKGLSKYYVFDVKKYSLEEFFSDIKAFKEKFYVRITKQLYYQISRIKRSFAVIFRVTVELA